MFGAAAATEILPSFFNLEDKTEKECLHKIIASLVVCPNDNIRIAIGKAIRDYIWAIDARFSEQCLYGAIQYAELAKDFYKPFPPSEKEQKNFSDQCEKIRSSILNGSLAQSSIKILTGKDSWFLLPIVNIIPHKDRSDFHNSILDATTSLLVEYRKKEQRERSDNFSTDFIDAFSQLLTNYCFHAEEPITDISFVKILLDNTPETLSEIGSILIGLLPIAEKNGQLEKYWTSWDLLAKHFAPIICADVSSRQSRRYETNPLHSFIATLLKTSYWNDNEQALQQLHFLLEGHKKEFTEYIKTVIIHPVVFRSFVHLFFEFPDIFDSNGLNILVKNFEREQPVCDYFSNDTVRYYVEVIIYRLQMSIRNITNEDIDTLLNILDIIIDKGSPCAFLLRESLFSRRNLLNS